MKVPKGQVTVKWQRQVIARLDELKMSRQDLAEKIGSSRALISFLLNSDPSKATVANSKFVDPINAAIGIQSTDTGSDYSSKPSLTSDMRTHVIRACSVDIEQVQTIVNAFLAGKRAS